ncbi:MAG TPA: glycerophosphodiester phosphodiesterase family protein [Phycisphaerae bacterium]|nr:glycerophosphodiester phosphodiesterase family protein [Phycisphaerae bacterium]
MSRKPVIAVGHRGAPAYAPENTVASFEEAIRLGARAVEFDLRMTADGVPVVLHDETLDRTTNGHGEVRHWEWNDLLRVDAGSWMHQRFAGTRVPCLDEALLAIGPYARPVIELKVEVPPAVLLASLRKYDLEGDALVISFEPRWLANLRRESRELALGLLAEQWSNELPAVAERVGAEVLGLHTEIIGTTQVAAAEAKRLEVWAYTANDVGMVAACAAMGVTGIITDRPDLIRAR